MTKSEIDGKHDELKESVLRPGFLGNYIPPDNAIPYSSVIGALANEFITRVDNCNNKRCGQRRNGDEVLKAGDYKRLKK